MGALSSVGGYNKRMKFFSCIYAINDMPFLIGSRIMTENAQDIPLICHDDFKLASLGNKNISLFLMSNFNVFRMK